MMSLLAIIFTITNICEIDSRIFSENLYLCTCSDQMGNKGAFINITGDDLTPKFTSFEAVVSIFFFFFSI